MKVGSELAQARERSRLSLMELSRRTKIGVSTLRAIERDDLQSLPGGIYTRGFLRAYAREVGCDPEPIVQRYQQQLDEQEESDEAREQEKAGERPPDSRLIDTVLNRPSPAPAALVAAIALGTGLFLFSSIRDRQAAPALSNPAGSHRERAPLPPAVETRTAGTSGVQPKQADAGPINQAHALQLDIQPSGACWLEGAADGQRVVGRLLQAGERVQIEAQRNVTLRVGDAGAFAFRINGLAGRQLGTAGQAVTIHLTPDNVQEFLSR
jgi:cytoskeletal protein RodZ